MGLAFGGGIVAADGTFDFSNVSSGLYTLEIQSTLGAASVPVEVRDADIFIDVPTINNATVRGTAILNQR